MFNLSKDTILTVEIFNSKNNGWYELDTVRADQALEMFPSTNDQLRFRIGKSNITYNHVQLLLALKYAPDTILSGKYIKNTDGQQIKLENGWVMWIQRDHTGLDYVKSLTPPKNSTDKRWVASNGDKDALPDFAKQWVQPFGKYNTMVRPYFKELY
jgi:hypothetical protein